MTTNEPSQLHRLTYVCSRTDLSRSTIYRLIERGDLKAVKVGKALRITDSEINRFIEELSTQSVES